MNCCSVPAHWAVLPTTAIPAPGRTRVMPVHRMRHQQIAMFAGKLLHALVRHRVIVERLHLLLLPLGGVAHQLVGGLPGVLFLLAADHLQSHAEADLVLAAMGARHLPDLG